MNKTKFTVVEMELKRFAFMQNLNLFKKEDH